LKNRAKRQKFGEKKQTNKQKVKNPLFTLKKGSVRQIRKKRSKKTQKEGEKVIFIGK
jgi:hypothetical protein